MKNIVINGRACSGKDEVTKYLVEHYGYIQVSFAEPIYSICRKLFRMKKKNRRLLQFVGQSCRLFYKNIWVVIAMRKAKQLNKSGKHVVISDCRQKNEYEVAVNKGFFPVKVVADLEVRIQRAIHRDGVYPDISLWEGKAETGADGLSYYLINNNDDVDSLHKKVDEMIRNMGD